MLAIVGVGSDDDGVDGGSIPLDIVLFFFNTSDTL